MDTTLRERLFALQDAQYQKFHGSLVPGAENIIGVRVPELRALAKKLATGQWQQALVDLGTDYYEERVVRGLIIAQAPMSVSARQKLLEEFVPLINNWAICDVVCSTIKEADKEQESYWNFLQDYLGSAEEYPLRFGLVMLLDHFVDEHYIESVLDVLLHVNTADYYAQMAAAWALSVCYIKFPVLTEAVFLNPRLDDEIRQKGIQKCTESYRVKYKDKQRLKEIAKGF